MRREAGGLVTARSGVVAVGMIVLAVGRGVGVIIAVAIAMAVVVSFVRRDIVCFWSFTKLVRVNEWWPP